MKQTFFGLFKKTRFQIWDSYSGHGLLTEKVTIYRAQIKKLYNMSSYQTDFFQAGHPISVAKIWDAFGYPDSKTV